MYMGGGHVYGIVAKHEQLLNFSVHMSCFFVKYIQIIEN
jgi:hypothetical protein